MKRLLLLLGFSVFLSKVAFADEPPKMEFKSYYMCSEKCGDNTWYHKIWVGMYCDGQLISYKEHAMTCELPPPAQENEMAYPECVDEKRSDKERNDKKRRQHK